MPAKTKPQDNSGIETPEETKKTESTEVAPVKQELATPGTGIGAFIPRLEDIEVPKLNIIQRQSRIKGDSGSLMLDQSYQLLEEDQEHEVLVLDALKRWKEDTPYDSKEMGRIADSEADAEKLARESEYEVIEFAEIIFLIPEIKGVDPDAFPLGVGGVNYALGKLYVQKDAYRMTYKRLNTFSVFNKGAHPNTKVWKLKVTEIEKGQYAWYVPSLSPTQQDTPGEILEFLKNLSA